MRTWVVGLMGMALLFMTGCGMMILRKPQALDVKKLAIVSVYANTDIDDVEGKQESKFNLLQALTGAQSKNPEAEAVAQIAAYGLKAFGEELEGAGPWKVVPSKDVLDSPGFKSLTSGDVDADLGSFLNTVGKAFKSAWVPAPGMPYIPASSLLDPSETHATALDRKDPKVVRELLAKVARNLNVDGVAVIGLNLAYKRGFLSGGGSSLFNSRGSATPMVAADIVIVTKDSQIAAENLVGSGVDWAEGPSAPMLKDDRPSLDDPKGDAMKAYFAGVKNYAVAVRNKITEELGKNN